MKYTLKELLADKELRKELLDGIFVFEDNEGDFFAVDFQKESMRQNHITVFEILYTLGGDELFEKLLAAGNTCLTKDPNAAKVGVLPIADAKGWYLKTNASSASAFASILNGLAGLENEERFFFSVEEESTTTHIVSNVVLNYETNIIMDEPDLRFDVDDEGVTSVFNCDENAVVSFSIQKGFELLEFDKFYKVEAVMRDDFDDDFESDQKTVGYKYQLAKDGKYGFFNLNFSQVIPPMFDDILSTKSGELIAWERLNVYFLEDKLKYGLYFSKSDWQYEKDVLDCTALYEINDNVLPDNSAQVHTLNLDDNQRFVLYSPHEELNYGFVFFNKRPEHFFSCTAFEGYKVTASGGVLRGENSTRSIFVKCSDFMPNGDFDINDCKKLYFGEEPEYKAAFILDSGKHVVEKDGYYALAKFDESGNKETFGVGHDMKFIDLLTPYAFTDIRLGNENHIIVDRFGKKGVFDLVRKKYIIPCDYERICSQMSGDYLVEKAGFVGVIRIIDDGRVHWVEQLHREN